MYASAAAVLFQQLLLTVVGITGLLSGDGTIDVTYYLFAFYTTYEPGSLES